MAGGSKGQGSMYFPCVILIALFGTEFAWTVVLTGAEHVRHCCLCCPHSQTKQLVGENCVWLFGKQGANPFSPLFAYRRPAQLPLACYSSAALFLWRHWLPIASYCSMIFISWCCFLSNFESLIHDDWKLNEFIVYQAEFTFVLIPKAIKTWFIYSVGHLM